MNLNVLFVLFLSLPLSVWVLSSMWFSMRYLSRLHRPCRAQMGIVWSISGQLCGHLSPGGFLAATPLLAYEVDTSPPSPAPCQSSSVKLSRAGPAKNQMLTSCLLVSFCVREPNDIDSQ
ncbi:hypothetical protein HD554DRAFT_1791252 [Boletus coccyginus]|nr:hypothetical protein HD554DRAFT_1791252 [Boletus coccyginus]